MGTPKIEESPSSKALATEIKSVGWAKLNAETGIHRTQLWRYSTGRGKPDAEQVAKLHRATDGRVAADGWESLASNGDAA